MAATVKVFNTVTPKSTYGGLTQRGGLLFARIVKNTNYQHTAQLSTVPRWFSYRNRRLFQIGSGISALLCGFGYLTHKLKIGLPIQNVQAASVNAPSHPPIRCIKNDLDSSGLKLTLYQYQTCPFCCKTRALLDYYGLSYDVVEVNSVRRTEVKWSKYRKVPILVCHGVGEEGYLQINDSSVILSLLESYLVDKSVGLERLHSYFPELVSTEKRGKPKYDYPNKYFIMYGEKKSSKTVDQGKEERKWRKWVDSWLVHTLSPNVYRTPSEALQAFRYFSDVGEWNKIFSSPERTMIIYVGAAAMYILGKVLKRRYNLQDDVRQSLYGACDDWVKAVGKKRKFMGGDQPNLADISVYGVLSSIEGCDAFKDLLNNSNIETWYYNTKHAVTTHQGAMIPR